MSRSLKKGPYVDQRLAAKVEKKGMNREPIKTWARSGVAESSSKVAIIATREPAIIRRETVVMTTRS